MKEMKSKFFMFIPSINIFGTMKTDTYIYSWFYHTYPVHYSTNSFLEEKHYVYKKFTTNNKCQDVIG